MDINSADDVTRIVSIIAVAVITIAVILLLMCLCKLYDIITCPCVCLARIYRFCCCFLGGRSYDELPPGGGECSYA